MWCETEANAKLLDGELLRKFRAGDREALTEVYWRHIDLVEAFVRRRMGSLGPADVADVIQEVFIKAFADRARAAYDPSREYAPYLCAIAHHAIIDHLRRHRREPVVEAAGLEQLAQRTEPPRDADPPVDLLTLSVVDAYVNGLDAAYRAVYVERYVHCRSQNEAANRLGLSRQQLRTIEGRLRKGLARALATNAKRLAPLARAEATLASHRASEER